MIDRVSQSTLEIQRMAMVTFVFITFQHQQRWTSITIIYQTFDILMDILTGNCTWKSWLELSKLSTVLLHVNHYNHWRFLPRCGNIGINREFITSQYVIQTKPVLHINIFQIILSDYSPDYFKPILNNAFKS